MSINLKPNSLELGCSFTVLSFGSSKKQGALQTAPFKVRCPIVFLILKLGLIPCALGTASNFERQKMLVAKRKISRKILYALGIGIVKF